MHLSLSVLSPSPFPFLFYFSYAHQCWHHLIRAFPSTLLKHLAFTISKSNFITYNTPLYNIPYIKTSIFLTLHLNILSLSFFILLLSFSVSLSSVSLFHNPAPPATISTQKKKNHLHIQSHKIKESSKSKNHKITTKTQNHLNQPIPISESPRSTHTQHPKPPRSTHEPSHRNQRTYQNQSKPLKLKLTNIKLQNPLTKPPQRPTMNHCRDPQSMKNHCSLTTPYIASRPHPRPTNSRCRENGK